MQETQVIIVGAGPAGIATSACLTVYSIPHIILERDDCVAPLWQKYAYDRLHLHLRKGFSELPHMPFPSWYPTYLSKDLFVQYMNTFTSHFKIAPLLSRNVEEAAFDRVSRRWIVKARNTGRSGGGGEVVEEEEYSSRFLVVASGNYCDPLVPEVEGLRGFGGEVMHSTKYKNGAGFRGERVLVVGSGNSGMEIALDLADHGAITSIVVRSPVHILSRWTTNLAVSMFKYLRLSVVDRIAVLVSKLEYGDLSKYGIYRDKEGPFAMGRKYGKFPVVDVGTIHKIKSGDIQVLPAMERIKGNEVLFQNGRSYVFDAIIFCTGFKPSTTKWFKEDEYYSLNKDGTPRPGLPFYWKGKNGLYCHGYCNGVARSGLRRIKTDAQDIAQDIIKSLLED